MLLLLFVFVLFVFVVICCLFELLLLLCCVLLLFVLYLIKYEDIDDATVRKWRGFSQRLQANRFIVGNVFAYRATDVSQLASVEDAVGPDNPMHLKSIIAEADILIPCWGSRNKLPQILWPHLDNLLFVLLHSGKPVYCFGKTASQDPKHPFIG